LPASRNFNGDFALSGPGLGGTGRDLLRSDKAQTALRIDKAAIREGISPFEGPAGSYYRTDCDGQFFAASMTDRGERENFSKNLFRARD